MSKLGLFETRTLSPTVTGPSDTAPPHSAPRRFPFALWVQAVTGYQENKIIEEGPPPPLSFILARWWLLAAWLTSYYIYIYIRYGLSLNTGYLMTAGNVSREASDFLPSSLLQTNQHKSNSRIFLFLPYRIRRLTRSSTQVHRFFLSSRCTMTVYGLVGVISFHQDLTPPLTVILMTGRCHRVGGFGYLSPSFLAKRCCHDPPVSLSHNLCEPSQFSRPPSQRLSLVSTLCR